MTGEKKREEWEIARDRGEYSKLDYPNYIFLLHKGTLSIVKKIDTAD